MAKPPSEVIEGRSKPRINEECKMFMNKLGLLLDNAKHGLALIRMLNYDKGARIGPIRVDIAATSACNYNCYFCKAHSHLRKEHVAPIHLDGATLQRLLIALKSLRVKNILFAGNGEPLLNRALPDIIKQYGEGFDIEILSNGSTLGIVDESLFSKLRYLTISINSGNGNSHTAIHGYKGANQFPKICEHIGRILQYRNARNKVKLNYVVTVDNVHELEDFEMLADKWSVQSVVRPMNIDFEELREKSVNMTNGEIDSPESLSPCYNGFIQPYIESNGNVLLCCDGQDEPLGNLYERDFTDIWQDEKNIWLRLEAVRMTAPLFKMCNGCANAQVHSRMFHNLYSRLPLKTP